MKGIAKRGPRIPPLPQAEWTDEVRDYFRLSEGMGCVDGEPLINVPLTMANHLDLANAYRPFGRHLLLHSTLSKRVQELITLRTAWLCHSDYEWAKHEVAARRIGMSDAELEGIRQGPDAPIWSDVDRALLRATDQLKDKTDIDDDLWRILSANFDRKQLLDMIFTIGMYAMLAMALNAGRVELEPGPAFSPA